MTTIKAFKRTEATPEGVETVTGSVTDTDGSGSGVQGPPGLPGDDGWSPQYRVVATGSANERRVLEVYSWTGGQGTPPTTGFIGSTGLVANAADALDVRGAAGQDGQDSTVEGPPGQDSVVPGPDGDDGWSPQLRAVTDGERRVLELFGWTGGEGIAPATGFIGATGLVADAADALDFRGPAGQDGDAGSGSGALNIWPTSFDDGDPNFTLAANSLWFYQEQLWHWANSAVTINFSNWGGNTPRTTNAAWRRLHSSALVWSVLQGYETGNIVWHTDGILYLRTGAATQHGNPNNPAPPDDVGWLAIAGDAKQDRFTNAANTAGGLVFERVNEDEVQLSIRNEKGQRKGVVAPIDLIRSIYLMWHVEHVDRAVLDDSALVAEIDRLHAQLADLVRDSYATGFFDSITNTGDTVAALKSVSTSSGTTTTDAAADATNPEFYTDSHRLIFYINNLSDAQITDVEQLVGQEFALSAAEITTSNLNTNNVFHFHVTTVSYQSATIRQIRATLIDVSKSDAFLQAAGLSLAAADPFGSLNARHFPTNSNVLKNTVLVAHQERSERDRLSQNKVKILFGVKGTAVTTTLLVDGVSTEVKYIPVTTKEVTDYIFPAVAVSAGALVARQGGSISNRTNPLAADAASIALLGE